MEKPEKRREEVPAHPDLATLPADGGPEFNRLIFSTSPYLLQHSRNPVDWFAWGEEAFAKARREKKPVFLSIGYSTCHWCHVMEHESFENQEVADFLREHFISIKVDREERPDLDHIYMEVCQRLTGGGGWPLTLFLTPDQAPFFAGTYFPRESRYGRPGFLELLRRVQSVWVENPAKLQSAADDIRRELSSVRTIGPEILPPDIGVQAVRQLESSYDEEWGGFSPEPKFPMGHLLMFLLQRSGQDKNPALLRKVEKTLEQMFRGGINDHLGGGFCRYSVDRRWLVPHFEKMLYDNALLILAFTDAWQRTRNPIFKQAVIQTVSYLDRELRAPGGGFFCAENADSEGVEGKFYLVTHQELLAWLGPAEGARAAPWYGITAEGNFEHGQNILHQPFPLAAFARQQSISEDEAETLTEEWRQQLFDHRSRRVHPSLDDKILTSWNGLMIAALSRAGRVFEKPEYFDSAVGTADFLLGKVADEKGSLRHSWRAQAASNERFLEDYAFLVFGLTELYQSTFSLRYLEKAVQLTEVMLADFSDPAGGFYLTPANGESLIVRPKEGIDGALPSANSVAAYNLVRLGRILAKPEWEAEAGRLFTSFGRVIRRAPSAFPMMLQAFDLASRPGIEIALVGASRAEVEPFLEVLRERYLPEATIIFSPTGNERESAERLLPFLRNLPAKTGPAAFVCKNQACGLAIASTEEFKRQLPKE